MDGSGPDSADIGIVWCLSGGGPPHRCPCAKPINTAAMYGIIALVNGTYMGLLFPLDLCHRRVDSIGGRHENGSVSSLSNVVEV